MTMKKKQIRLLLLFLFLLAATTGGSLVYEVRDIQQFIKDDEEAIQFSQPSGCYQSDITIKIKKIHQYPFLTKIHYTLDGSEPTQEDPVYKKAIMISSTEQVSVNSIRAAAFYRGERSQITTGTYMVGKNAFVRYQIPVVSITGNEEDLFGEEEGILVPGKLYSDYLSDGGEEEASWDIPANFNQTDWMRRVNFSIIERGGVQVLNQESNLCITGNSSRKYSQKPLKLKSDQKFELYFSQVESSTQLPHVTAYKKLKFRNGGIDFSETRLRGALVSNLARQAGFEDTAPVQPTVVYINNQYYGVADMQPVYTESYLGDLYGIDKEKIEIIDGGEAEFLAALGYPGDAEFKDMDSMEKEQLESKIDIDQLLRYYAFELIVGNADWPHNNIKMWRYTGEEDSSNPYTDGRGRFLLFDFDSAFECLETNEDPFKKLFYAVTNGAETGELWDLLPDLMSDEEYKNKFVNILMDDISGDLSTENMLNVLSTCELETGTEINYALLEGSLDESQDSLSNRSECVDRLKNAVQKRGEEIYSYIYQYFGGETVYDLTVVSPEVGNKISVSTENVYGGTEDFVTKRCGQYYTKITADVLRGKKFCYWTVNGKKVYDKELQLNDSYIMSENDRSVRVELVTQQDENADLIISKISENGDEDYIELYNPTDKEIRLSNYFITDNHKDKHKFQCPDVKLAPSQCILLNGKSNPVVNEYIMNFNLKDGEVISLYRMGEENASDSMEVKKMSPGESYGRYLETNEWRYFIN